MARRQPRPLLLLALAAALLAGGAAAAASGDAQQQQQEQGTMPHLDLTKATIQPKLSALPADDAVLIEFYASWCPACRGFKPDYEKAAAFILAKSKVHVYRLDCAVHADTCDKYQVSGYPTMYVGRAADVAAAEVKALERFDYGKYHRNAAGVVQFVAKHFQLDLTYSEEAAKAAAEAGGAGAAGSAGKAATPAAGAAGSGSSGSGSGSGGAGNATAAAAAAATKKTKEWAARDVEAATRQLFTAITSYHPTSGLQERRAALLLLLKLWGAGHPLPACRAGAGALARQLPALWPPDAAADPWGSAGSSGGGGDDGKAAPAPPRDVCAPPAGRDGGGAAAAAADAAEGASAAAGGGAGAGGWVSCRGTVPDSRGFTCGLWLLFHTVAVRLPEADGGALLVSALRGFAQYFFQCEVCRKHFVAITSSPEAAAVRSRRDGVLWLWRVHNEVNARLHKIEAQYGHSSSGDPAYPKLQWPTAADCPKCRRPLLPSERAAAAAAAGNGSDQQQQQQQQAQAEEKWDEGEVYPFLLRWYGRQPQGGSSSSGSASAAASKLAGGGSGNAAGKLAREGSGGEADAAGYLDRVGSSGGAAGAGLFGLLSGKAGLLLLLVLGLVGWLVRSQLLVGRGGGGANGRRHLPLKGPGMFPRPGVHHHHAHHAAHHHHHSPLARHTPRANGGRF